MGSSAAMAGRAVPERAGVLLKPRRAIDDDQLRRGQTTGHQVIQESPPGGLAFAAHAAQGEQYLLAVTTNAQRHQQRQAGRLSIQANPDNRAVEDQADDVVAGKIALLPGLPVGLHLAPGPPSVVLPNPPPDRPAP